MLKVAVIDDKPMIRKAIVKAIDWPSLNCIIVGQAEDGLEGRAMLARELPDLLITDIKMPGLSGLDLANWMTSHLPGSKTILITGHREFEYARMAVKQGVYDLIVKPIDYDDLYRVIDAALTDLTSARREVQEKEQLAGEVSRLEAEFRSLAPSVSSKLVADSIGGKTMDEQEWKEVMRAFSAEGIVFSLMLVRCVRMNESAGGGQVPADGLKHVFGHVQEMKSRMGMDTLECFHNGQLAVVVSFKSSMSQRDMEVSLRRFGHELAVQIERQHGIVINVASSSYYKTRYGLKQAYEETNALLEQSFFQNDRQVLTPQMPRLDNQHVKHTIMKELEEFTRTLESEPKDVVLFAVERLLDRMEEYSTGSITVMKALLLEVCLLAVRFHYRATGNEFAVDKGIDQIVNEVSRLNSLSQARSYLTDIVLGVKSAFEGNGASYGRMTQHIIDYINVHYHQDVSLTSIAERFKLSPNYLSRILRQETGDNFVNIVSKTRIQAAKRLLEDPTRKVNEVGEMVGFKEYAYFFQVFKRFTGSAPKEYQQKFKRN